MVFLSFVIFLILRSMVLIDFLTTNKEFKEDPKIIDVKFYLLISLNHI